MRSQSWPFLGRGARGTLLIGVLAVVGATLIAVFASLSTPLVRVAENRAADARVAWLSPPREQAPDIVVILITDATLEGLTYRSPLDRNLISQLLVDLERKGVAAIGLDVLIDRPSEPQKDELLKKTLHDLGIPVVVASLSHLDGLDERRESYLTSFLEDIEQGLPLVFRDTLDEAVREALIHRDAPIGARLGLAAALADKVGAPLPTQNRVAIDYRSGDQPGTSAFAIYPAEEVANMPRSWLDNRIALVGPDLDLVDRHRTPLSVASGAGKRNMPGVLIHAHVLSQILEGRSLRVPSPWSTLLLSALSAVLGALLAIARINLGLKVAGAVILVPISWILTFAVYTYGGPLLPIVAPNIAYMLAAIIMITWQWRSEHRQRRFIHDAFGRYLSPSVVNQLVEDPERLGLGGESREITFFFTDIAGFTTLTENTEPTKFVRLLNEYLDEACTIVIDHGGTIDKIVGDALHVMFSAPLVQLDHCQRAVDCAMAVDAWACEFSARKAREGITFGMTRIGVNSGRTVVGNFGGRLRFDYTAHGDAINTAARLESANKHFGTRVCVSATTARHCDGVCFRPIGELVLKGKSEGVEAFVPLLGGDPSEGLFDEYQAAYRALAEGHSGACEAFRGLAGRFPDDPLTALHAARCAAGESGVTIVLAEK